ncbi:MAG: hypothetical protein EZS28_006195 [Streblomastix strix]|uniref:Tyr recombinase domain-containing protein n=1 Tax=Streblomastix strix TaxID=222440 RepID=A0A5J4WV99_9EUKA|nr:MAG: hypothetical protein EZS28_006195 [Streblomastix strix]
MKPHIIITEVLAQFTSVNTSASSALQFLNGLSSMLSLTFNIDLKNNHMLQFTRRAISAHIIVKPKYEDTWNVGILFDYWREKGSNRNLTNIELQTKLTSLHMTICSMRPAEIEEISLRHSVICEQTDKVDLRLQPKTKSGLHQHKLPKTRDRTYGALWWIEDITIPAKRGQISLRLKKLLDLMGIKGKQVYSFRHSAATQLVVMGLDETLLNAYTGHARNSKSTNDYYVFAERLKDIEIATKLSDTRGQVELGLLVIRGCIIIYYNFALVPPISLKLYINAFIQFFTLVPTLCGEMPSRNIDKQVSELLTMVSNKLVNMRCQQSFMGGYAHAVR